MSLNPYLVFDFEMQAVKNFITVWAKLKNPNVNPDQEFFRFMYEVIPTEHWEYFHFDKTATKKEKWLYLHSLGVGVVKIRKITGGSPNQIYKVVQEKPNIRHYMPDVSLDFLMEAWQPYRKLIPNEFFIKYLK